MAGSRAIGGSVEGGGAAGLHRDHRQAARRRRLEGRGRGGHSRACAGAAAIAGRLLRWLPGKSAQAVPAMAVPRSIGGRMKLGLAPWLVWGALAVAILLVTVYLQADHNLEPAAR